MNHVDRNRLRSARGALLVAGALALLAGPAAAQTPEAPVPAASDSLAPAPAGAAAPASGAPAPAGARRLVRLDQKDHTVARTGPGDDFAIAGVYPRDLTLEVIAKSGDWYNVRLSDSETGWIHAALCTEFDDLSDLEFRPNPKLYTRTGSFTLGGYGGAYAFDRKSNSLVLGARLGYYVFDRIQVEGGMAWTRVRRPAEIVESLFGLTLEAEDFEMMFYHFNLTWELLPGRQMVPYLSAGVGSAILKGETEPSFNFGAGTQLFITKRLATRWEFRDYRFDSGPDGSRVTNDNVEFSFGTTYLF